MEVIAKKETDPTEAEVAIEEAAAEEGTEEVPTKGRTNQISRSIHNKRNVNSHSSNYVNKPQGNQTPQPAAPGQQQ